MLSPSAGELTRAKTDLDWSHEQTGGAADAAIGLVPVELWDAMVRTDLRTVIALTVLCAGTSLGLVKAYSIEPSRAAWSNWTRPLEPDNHVSEVLTCNFDTLAYVELFAGVKGNGGLYTATVYEDEVPLMSSKGVQDSDCRWVRFENWSSQAAFTKGKQYEFRFTRGGQDSIHYYYDSACGYDFGQMIAPPTVMPPGYGLAMRAYGRMNAASGRYWGACTRMAMPFSRNATWRDTWESRAKEARLGWGKVDLYWRRIESPSPGTFDFSWSDTIIDRLENAGCEPVGLLLSTPTWASTRIVGGDTATYCAPRNLWPDPESINYWVKFCSTLVQHNDGIHVWEIWNEPNDTCVSQSLLHSGIPGFWRRPNLNYLVGFDSLRGMCKLYMRMTYLADSVIKHTSGHTDDAVVLGGTCCVLHSDPRWLVSGAVWVDMCYRVAAENGWGVFWDAVGVHPYQDDKQFTPEHLEEDADTLHAIMRNHGDAGRALWDTEMGWNLPPEDSIPQDMYACHLAKTYAVSAACLARPQGGYDRTCWYFFWREPPHWAWGLVESTLARQKAFYAFKQARAALNGKRFSARALTGDARDDSVRMYEFEDTATVQRTWICWRDGNGKQGTDVRLPVRTNTLAAESLAYTGTPPTFSPKVTNDGWLSIDLDSRPVFISERTAPQRPDLRVDSVRLVQASSIVRAWVTNHGTRATPVRSESRKPYATWAMLMANGDYLAQQARMTSIAVNQQVVFEFRLGQTQPPDNVLLSVTVNPTQTYVELGTDDNTGYARVVRP
jgi:hypothetical protein